ncbi:MAG TPA: PIN domain-containing protein [Thermoanaerobaculia bacterium]|jgi:predicted nucleic acid-binding protein|nr:PIN domain-containing protein [Thermoanaerobaculia bacterium]
MVTDAILDTSILIDLLRAFPPATDWFSGLGRQRVAITPVVWMETVQGATNREKRAQAIRFLRRFSIEHPTADDNRWAMRQTATFHLSHGIQLEDTMIASVAARLAVPLYTTNLKHFLPLPSVNAKKPY